MKEVLMPNESSVPLTKGVEKNMTDSQDPWWARPLSKRHNRIAGVIVYTIATIFVIFLMKDSGIPFVYRIPLGIVVGIFTTFVLGTFLSTGI